MEVTGPGLLADGMYARFRRLDSGAVDGRDDFLVGFDVLRELVPGLGGCLPRSIAETSEPLRTAQRILTSSESTTAQFFDILIASTTTTQQRSAHSTYITGA